MKKRAVEIGNRIGTMTEKNKVKVNRETTNEFLNPRS
jgi:hypothetical protein